MDFSLKNFLISRTQLPTLESSMDAFSLRQKVIANNVANVETPGFIRSEVRFEEEFRKALDDKNNRALTRTDRQHIPTGHNGLWIDSNVETMANDDYSNGVNNVDLDWEMGELAKVQIKFDAMTKLTKKHLTLLRSAIKGM